MEAMDINVNKISGGGSDCSDSNKGFLTVALGDYYAYLAKNLAMSYSLNQDIKYPFAVITDKNNERMLRDFFDIVITIDEPPSYLIKLSLLDYTPFDETIFIDADSFIIRDISDWWAVFEDSGNDVAVFGWNVDISSPRVGQLVSDIAIKKYGLQRYIGFNGGVYFFKRNDIARSIYERAKEHLQSYQEDDLHMFSGKPGDEPVMEISLVEHDIYGVEDPDKIRMFCTPGMKNLSINVLSNVCYFEKYDYSVTPACMHWGTGETFGDIYRREAFAINLAYKGFPKKSSCFIAKFVGGAYRGKGFLKGFIQALIIKIRGNFNESQ